MEAEPREILRSALTFHHVERIMLKRGEGIDGGDAIVVMVHEPSQADLSTWYYLMPDTGSRQVLRLASRIRGVRVSLGARLTSKVRSPDYLCTLVRKSLAEEGEARIPSIGDEYPDARIIIVIYDDGTAELQVELDVST